MIKRILECVIVVIIVSYFNYSVSIDKVYDQFNCFYNDIETNAIDYMDEDKVYLVFDYEYINSLLSVYFSEYHANIVKNNECYFTLEVTVQECFFIKKINEGYLIERGHIYEEFN